MPGDWTPDDFAGAELVPVGTSQCLFRPDNHAVGLLNEDAAAIWRALSDNGPLVPADELIARWRAAGFLGQILQSDLGAARTRPGRAQQPARHTITVGSARAVHVGVDDEQLAALLRAVLAPIETDGPRRVGVNVCNADAPASAFEIWSDDVLLAVCGTRSDARRIALQAILLGLNKPGTVSAILHASAVAVHGKCVLLAGATGSGKTTLIAALVASGAKYLGDDLIALGRDGRWIGGFPIAASIKSGSWDLIGQIHPQLYGAPVFELGARQVRYIDLGNRVARNNVFLPVSALVFPNFQEAAALRAEPMAAEVAFARLIETGTEIVGNPRSIRPLAALVEDYPCWRIGYGDLDDAVREVLAIAGRS